MDFLTGSSTTYALTDEALDLMNSIAQLLTVTYAVMFALLVFLILIVIFKS